LRDSLANLGNCGSNWLPRQLTEAVVG
jgi:hypothetical protein